MGGVHVDFPLNQPDLFRVPEKKGEKQNRPIQVSSNLIIFLLSGSTEPEQRPMPGAHDDLLPGLSP